MAVCFRKEHIIDVGGYMDLPYMEDYYLWLRLLNKKYKLVNLDTILVSARVGEAMINRRKGFKYVKSEITMLKYILNSGLEKIHFNSIFFIKNIKPNFTNLPSIKNI